MRKPFILGSLILVVIVGCGIYLLTNKNDQPRDDVSREVSSSRSSTPEPISDSRSTPTPGSYIDYKDDVVASTRGTKLLFFHAPWCPQCRELEASIKQKGVPEGVTIIKVDYDSSRSLRQKYGVTLQTTVVRVDDSGNLVKKFVAYENPSIDTVKEKLL